MNFRKVSPGTSFKDSPAATSNWQNAVTDMVQRWLRNLFGGDPKKAVEQLRDKETRVKCSNATGEPFLRGQCVQLYNYRLGEVNHRKRWFEGVVYDGGDKWGVLLRGIVPGGDQSEVQLLGVCTARVNVTNLSHTHANPSTSSRDFQSDVSGDLEFLSTPQQLGVQDVVVRFATQDLVSDELRGTVDSVVEPGVSGNTYRVLVLKSSPAPVALPTGTPVLAGTILVADLLNQAGSISPNDIIRAIHKVGVDSYNPGGGAVPVDWEYLPVAAATPVRVVLIDGTSMSQDPGDPIDPISVNGSLTRIYSGTLSTEGDIWVRVNDHKRLGRVWQPKAAAYKALLTGTYDPNAVDPTNYPTPDERPLYTIDPESDGETVARVTTEASAADWSTVGEPVPSTDGRCTIYKVDETGATVEDETGVEFKNYFKKAIPVGSIVLLEEFQGQLICGQVIAGDQLIAKLTATVPKRTSDNYGTLGSVSLGHLVAGVWTEVLTGQTVWNPALNPVHIPSGETIQIPVGDSNGHWVLQNPTDLQQVKSFSTGGPQLIMHCGSTEYEWKDYDPIVDLRLDGYNFQYDTICDTWQTWHTGEECEEE